MLDELTELHQRVRKLSDEELLQMVNADIVQYRQVALDYAKAEIKERGLSLERKNANPDSKVKVNPHFSNLERSLKVPALWMLPALALCLPPIVLLIGYTVGSHMLLAAFHVLGLLSPVLGLTTLIVLLIQWLAPGEVPEAAKRSRALAAWLAGLSIVAPAWLIVMYLCATGFSR